MITNMFDSYYDMYRESDVQPSARTVLTDCDGNEGFETFLGHSQNFASRLRCIRVIESEGEVEEAAIQATKGKANLNRLRCTRPEEEKTFIQHIHSYQDPHGEAATIPICGDDSDSFCAPGSDRGGDASFDEPMPQDVEDHTDKHGKIRKAYGIRHLARRLRCVQVEESDEEAKEAVIRETKGRSNLHRLRYTQPVEEKIFVEAYDEVESITSCGYDSDSSCATASDREDDVSLGQPVTFAQILLQDFEDHIMGDLQSFEQELEYLTGGNDLRRIQQEFMHRVNGKNNGMDTEDSIADHHTQSYGEENDTDTDTDTDNSILSEGSTIVSPNQSVIDNYSDEGDNLWLPFDDVCGIDVDKEVASIEFREHNEVTNIYQEVAASTEFLGYEERRSARASVTTAPFLRDLPIEDSASSRKQVTENCVSPRGSTDNKSGVSCQSNGGGLIRNNSSIQSERTWCNSIIQSERKLTSKSLRRSVVESRWDAAMSSSEPKPFKFQTYQSRSQNRPSGSKVSSQIFETAPCNNDTPRSLSEPLYRLPKEDVSRSQKRPSGSKDLGQSSVSGQTSKTVPCNNYTTRGLSTPLYRLQREGMMSRFEREERSAVSPERICEGSMNFGGETGISSNSKDTTCQSARRYFLQRKRMKFPKTQEDWQKEEYFAPTRITVCKN